MHEASKALTGLAADIVSAYVSKNTVPAGELPSLIRNVHDSLEEAEAEGDDTPPEPAVPVKRAVSASHVTCLECGARFKSLKRHLRTRHGLEAGQYREKWNLGADFPLVAPEYSDRRSATAKALGLGRNRRAGARKTAASKR